MASRFGSEPSPSDGARAKVLEGVSLPATIGPAYRKHRIWTLHEKALITAVRVLTDNKNLRTQRVSVQELVDMCGARKFSKRSAQRALAVLGDPKKAGVFTIHREKTDGGAGKQNEKNWYEFHQDRFLEWTGKERPKSWDPPKKERGGGSDSASPPPTAYAAAVEAARLAAGRPDNDPHTAKLARLAGHVDTRAANLSRAEAELLARRQKLERDIADLEAKVAGIAPAAAAQPAPAPEPPAATPPPAPSPVPTEPAIEPEEATGRDAQERGDFDRETLFALRTYQRLAPIANEADAAKIGVSARRARVTLEQLAEGIERLVYKLRRGDYPNATGHDDLLRLARAYARRQWASVHAPLPNVLRQLPKHAPDELDGDDEPDGDVDDEALPELLGDDVTAEELTEMRKQLHEAARAAAEGESAWKVAIEHVRALLPVHFGQWFCQVEFEGLADGVLSLRADNSFVFNWVQTNYEAALVAKLREQIGRVTVRWTVGKVQSPVAVLDRPSRRS